VTTVISYETLVLKFDVPGHCGLVRVTSIMMLGIIYVTKH